MAESTEPNPVVFFDVTLGGMAHAALYQRRYTPAYRRYLLRLCPRCPPRHVLWWWWQ